MKRGVGGVNGGVGGGEIVQVEGGHIIRSTGRKDRHSKVFTAKGPRDRRVRLSAHTAIQFYDVQDRLGYDRPSKAVDWLIKKAKNAIDKLAELPPWNPNDGLRVNNIEPSHEADAAGSSGYEFRFHKPQMESVNANTGGETSSFMLQEHDTQSIAETMKSFFPMNSGSSLMNFQNYPHEIMPPRAASIQTEDLGLSLHTLPAASNPVSFDANFSRMVGWAHPHHHQSIPPPPPPSAAAFSQGGAFSQREPLQSNYSHLFHAWEERAATLPSANSNHHFAAEFQVPARIHGEEEEEHGGMADIKPSSPPPNSHY